MSHSTDVGDSRQYREREIGLYPGTMFHQTIRLCHAENRKRCVSSV